MPSLPPSTPLHLSDLAGAERRGVKTLGEEGMAELRTAAELLALHLSTSSRQCRCRPNLAKRRRGGDGNLPYACQCASYLNLCGVSLRPPEVALALQHNEFSELGISGNPALGEDAECLAQAVMARSGLFASRCNLGPEGGQALACALAQLSPGSLRIEQLGLNSNRLGEKAVLDIVALFGRGHFTTLKVLGLSANSLGDSAALGETCKFRSHAAVSLLA